MTVFVPPKMKYTNDPESSQQREKRLKDDFMKNFVNINFYGMQSNVKNPMNSPGWKFSPSQSLNIESETRKLF